MYILYIMYTHTYHYLPTYHFVVHLFSIAMYPFKGSMMEFPNLSQTQ